MAMALAGCDDTETLNAAQANAEPPTSAAPPSAAPTPAPTPAPAPTPSPTPTPAPPPAAAPPPATAQSATLTWQANTDADLAGYRIYYGTTSGRYLQARGQGIPTRATSHTVSELQSGARYYFALTAVDQYGNESGYTQEVSKQIP